MLSHSNDLLWLNYFGVIMSVRVAVYCRISTQTEMQQHSLDCQRSYYNKIACSNDNFELVGIYVETASGLNKKRRKQFNAMMKACRQNKIDLIITKSISRFARNALEFLETIHELKDLGVDVYFESEHLRLSEEGGEFRMAIYAAIMQEESLAKSRSTKWGISSRFASGESKLADRICYGYKHDLNGNLVIDEETSKNVILIFDLYLQGYSLSGICKELKKRGIKTPTGKENWTSATIDKVLSNEKYTGNVLLQKTYVTDVFNKKQKKNCGEMTKYLYEGNHVGFISEDKFQAVQAEKDKRSNIEHDETGRIKRKGSRYSSETAGSLKE